MCKRKICLNASFNRLSSKTICKIKQQIFTWEDVLFCCEFLGILQPYWNDLKSSIAACRHAELTGYSIDPDSLQVAANELRYAFNLITAEETEEWLRSRDLCLDDLNDFLTRIILKSHFENQLPEIRKQVKIDNETVAEHFWPQAILNNDYPQLITPLISRIVVKEFKPQKHAPIAEEITIIEKEFCQREGIALRDLPAYLARNSWLQDSFDYYVAVEAHFRKFCDQLLTEDTATILLKSLQNQLIRIEYETVCLADLERAKEAYFCVTEDGASLSDIALVAQGSYLKLNQFLDEIPEGLQRILLSAAVEEAIPPTPGEDDDKFYIYRVFKKIDPQLGDPLIFTKLRKKCIKETIAPIIEEHVTWLKWDTDLSHD